LRAWLFECGRDVDLWIWCARHAKPLFACLPLSVTAAAAAAAKPKAVNH